MLSTLSCSTVVPGGITCSKGHALGAVGKAAWFTRRVAKKLTSADVSYVLAGACMVYLQAIGCLCSAAVHIPQGCEAAVHLNGQRSHLCHLQHKTSSICASVATVTVTTVQKHRMIFEFFYSKKKVC
jgi:hypothetical protein